MNAAALELRDLHVTYHVGDVAVPAVRGIDLTIQPGETVGLAGESGCGKSTIGASILRLLPPTATVDGSVLLGGEDVRGMNPGRLRAVRWTKAAIVFQGALHSLNPVQRVGSQIEEAVAVHAAARSGQPARVGELLERVGLPPARATEYPHQLSGGQRQRVLIALALACAPDVLIADEPTTALDVMVQAQVLALLAELQRDEGMAMLFITHDLSVLSSTCERVSIMYAGQIVEEGPARTVLAHPEHPYTKALAAAFPTIRDAASRMRPSGLQGDPPDPVELPGGCPFHPRCDVALPSCSTDPIDLRRVAHGHRAACVHVAPQRSTVG
jgi:peptide/nickel transport system ATP-binding protein